MQCSPLPYSCNSLVVVQNMRVDFQFDKAAFTFNALPFKLPYPVPFKLLGDETKVYDLQSVCCLNPVLQLCCKDFPYSWQSWIVWLSDANLFQKGSFIQC